MRVRVSVRINPATGEVDLFQVDDVGGPAREGDHDARHERAARQAAAVLDPRAGVEEVTGPGEPIPPLVPRAEEEPESHGGGRALEQGGG